MGVPALFRWLSKKYPKIVAHVEEEQTCSVTVEGDIQVPVPVDVLGPNPNGEEFDNLYLDMNGIVHPCTHPEGKPAPKNEEEMMLEIFKYTERIFNMIRPRKLLFMAVDGVAPRAKMNQQRSRRFRSVQEAADKQVEKEKALKEWTAMGKEAPEEYTQKPWDSNAITPGTPFMTLLSESLKFWVVQKINSDPGWRSVQVIISDASVPGEGEHKIMDFIRRQRVNPGWNPNTNHVMYGLDADLIMLSLATHEPYFKVLREDVFGQDPGFNQCRRCKKEGHHAADCKEEEIKIVDEKKFVFLDVSVLREYLEVELNITEAPFRFDLENAIDDWILLIFFVGNDFLPHLPSLEIREGAIDTLLGIWKTELPRMGGYLTDSGRMDLSRAQKILEGIAHREDGIFTKRREVEERRAQAQADREATAKRRKTNDERVVTRDIKPSSSLNLSAPLSATNPLHPSLPPRPDFAVNADLMGFGAVQPDHAAVAAKALAGSNDDVIANRRAIRMANLSAAEMLKAEIGLGPRPLKASSSLPPKPVTSLDIVASASLSAKSSNGSLVDTTMIAEGNDDSAHAATSATSISIEMQETDVQPSSDAAEAVTSQTENKDGDQSEGIEADKMPVEVGDVEGDRAPAKLAPSSSVETIPDTDVDVSTVPDESFISATGGVKRKRDDDQLEETLLEDEEEEAPPDALAMVVSADGSVEQEDRVRLFEAGYRERYYQQKFGVELSDKEFRKKVTTSYMEGLCWVLQYYYQGTPSWQWYYPYHFAPFAADFEDVENMDIKFTIGAPFRPYEQLMGVFPAASGVHIPEPFRGLMTDESSPILDFYPTTFQIDMNGKKMLWQGVALLPFIDEKRLLEAMAPRYNQLSEDEVRRNTEGNHVLFTSNEHTMYTFLESIYGKRKNNDPIPIDPRESAGLNGFVLPNPECLPGSTYSSPFRLIDNIPSIPNDTSLSALYFFPPQTTPHRSVLLPGVKRKRRVLTPDDLERTRRQGQGRGGRSNNPSSRGGYSNGYSNGSNHYNRQPDSYITPTSYTSSYAREPARGRNNGGYGGPRNNRGAPPYGGGGMGRGGPPYNAYSGNGGRPQGGRNEYGLYGSGGYGGYGNNYQANAGRGGGQNVYNGGGYGGSGDYGGYGGYGGSYNSNPYRGGRGRG